MKNDIILREIKQSDKAVFILAMQQSQSLHHPWVKAPSTVDANFPLTTYCNNKVESCPPTSLCNNR